MKKALRSGAIFLVILHSIAGCVSPISLSEIQPFAIAVGDSVNAATPILAKRQKRETDNNENARFTSGRAVVALTPECEELNLDIVAKGCKLKQIGLDQLGNITGADAIGYTMVIKDYVIALNLLASADSKADISSAASVLQSSIGNLSSAVSKPGLAAFAAKLDKSGDAPGAVAGFIAEQARRAELARLLKAADPEIQTLSSALEQVLNEELGIDTIELYTALRNADQRATEARSISEFVHREAVNNLHKSYEAYISAVNTSIPAAIRKLASTHAALTKKMNGRASAKEIQTYLVELKNFVSNVNKIKETYQ